ncbi:MAG: 50S ribosomal protein L32 [Myxococcaceae bacterium]
MGVPKKRHSKSRRDSRRAANNKLGAPVQVIKCPKCKEPILPHRACKACGHYAGREVVAVD